MTGDGTVDHTSQEGDQVSGDIVYATDPKDAEKFYQLEDKKIDAGLMGKIFGSPEWAAASIAWVTIFLLVCSGVYSLVFTTAIQPADYWKIITPLITLALGYLFGRQKE